MSSYGRYPLNLRNPLGCGYVETARYSAESTFPAPFPYQSLLSEILGLSSPALFIVPEHTQLESGNIIHFMVTDGVEDIILRPNDATVLINHVNADLTFVATGVREEILIYTGKDSWHARRWSPLPIPPVPVVPANSLFTELGPIPISSGVDHILTLPAQFIASQSDIEFLTMKLHFEVASGGVNDIPRITLTQGTPLVLYNHVFEVDEYPYQIDIELSIWWSASANTYYLNCVAIKTDESALNQDNASHYVCSLVISPAVWDPSLSSTFLVDSTGTFDGDLLYARATVLR
jgi:hypothetical protein